MSLLYLHSPVWYGLLAAAMRWTGLSPDQLYFHALCLSHAAPPVALYFIACRYLHFSRAFLLALVFQFHPNLTIGISSAFGGMWTFSLGIAFYILFLAQSSRFEKRSERLSALLLAWISITHLYVLVAGVLTILCTWILRILKHRFCFRQLCRSSCYYLLALTAGACYWLGFLWSYGGAGTERQFTSSLQNYLLVLLTVTDFHYFDGMPSDPTAASAARLWALPLLLLLTTGLTGLMIRIRRGITIPGHDSLWLLSTIIVALWALTNLVPVPILGPNPYRYLFILQTALAFSSILVLQRVRFPSFSPPFQFPALLFIAVLSVVMFERPLESVTAEITPSGLEEIDEVWQWLDQHASTHARIYVQDTSLTESALSSSHILALTHSRTGLFQVGTYYGFTPTVTGYWTSGEGDKLFGRRDLPGEELKQLLNRTNIQFMVTSSKRTVATLRNLDYLVPRFETEHFRIWEYRDFEHNWLWSEDTCLIAKQQEFSEGYFRATIGGCSQPASVVLKTSYHPGWIVIRPASAQTGSTMDGLLEITQIDPSENLLVLEWQPTWLPFGISGVGCALLALALLSRHRADNSV